MHAQVHTCTVQVRSISSSQQLTFTCIASTCILGFIQGGKTWDIPPPPKAVSPPLKNYHNQNEISQVIHVHNISTFTEWLEVPLECLRIYLRASIFPKFPGGHAPRPPQWGPAKAHPLPHGLNVNFCNFPSNLKILYEPLASHVSCPSRGGVLESSQIAGLNSFLQLKILLGIHCMQ